MTPIVKRLHQQKGGQRSPSSELMSVQQVPWLVMQKSGPIQSPPVPANIKPVAPSPTAPIPTRAGTMGVRARLDVARLVKAVAAMTADPPTTTFSRRTPRQLFAHELVKSLYPISHKLNRAIKTLKYSGPAKF